MATDVVVTGAGAVNAAGASLETFWDRTVSGRLSLAPISRFDATGFPVRVVGEAGEFDAKQRVPRRFLAKTDRFTQLAFGAVDEALDHAKLTLDRVDRTRVGVYFGNNTGGWDICERGFAEYYVDGADVVNPWQATAWFLAAPQGFLTIRHGLRGMSKSFSGDRASGAVSCYYAMRSVQWDRNDVVLTGGCEAPVSALSLLCFHASRALSDAADPAVAYRPFDRAADGLVVGEGAAALVFERADHAAARDAPVYAYVLGGAHGTSGADPAGYAAVIAKALRDAGRTAADVDVVFCDGSAYPAGDRFEAAALAAVFGSPDTVPVTVPKSGFGHLYGGAFGTDVVCGLLAIRDGVIPPTLGSTGPALGGLDLVRDARPADVTCVLVTSYSRYGSCVAMVLEAPGRSS